MKIAVIGHSGSGKSTPARRIAEETGVPVLHLDQIHWLPGWQERPDEESRRMVKNFMDTHADWVIEGNYDALLFKRRMKEADQIVFLCFNRFSCLFRILKRYLSHRGKTRSSMAEGCREKIDFEFFLWILYNGRKREKMKKFRFVCSRFGAKTVRIRNQRQLDRYYRRIADDF